MEKVVCSKLGSIEATTENGSMDNVMEQDKPHFRMVTPMMETMPMINGKVRLSYQVGKIRDNRTVVPNSLISSLYSFDW